jgi:GAF domain-containing protein
MHQQTASVHSSRSDDFGNGWMKLIDAVEKLSAAHEPDAIARIVVDAARRLCGADGASFVLRDGDLCHYVDEAAIAQLWKGGRFPISACIAGWCMLNRETAIIPDIDQDERIPHDMYRTTFVRSLVTVPVGGEAPVAAIGAYWAREQAPDAAAVMILEALARSTATALAGNPSQDVDQACGRARRAVSADGQAVSRGVAGRYVRRSIGCHFQRVLLQPRLDPALRRVGRHAFRRLARALRALPRGRRRAFTMEARGS